jgi:hypothetical protein
MALLPLQSTGSLATDISARLEVDGGAVVDGQGGLGTESVTFGEPIPGPVGPQGPIGVAGPTGPIGPTAIVVGPTPPSDTSLLWVDTS